MSKKIIFLDFDGVLNSSLDWGRTTKNPNKKGLTGILWDAEDIDTQFVKRLNKIIRETGAEIAYSTSWRLYRNLEQLTGILECRGLKGTAIGLTPDLSQQGEIWFGSDRADEVKKWLDSCEDEVYSFVILDDGWEEGFIKQFGDNFILMEKSAGLQKHHVKKAIKILGKKDELREVQKEGVDV